MRIQRIATFLAALLAAGLWACAGSDGKNGANGQNGQDGQPGISSGTISGTLTYQPNPAANPLPAALPASNVNVALIPDVAITAVTDATGAYELANVPAGIYSIKFTGNAFATLQVDSVSVVATKNVFVNKLLTAANPLVLTPQPFTAPAGFNAPTTMKVTVAGGTPPYAYKWSVGTVPTPVTLNTTTGSSSVNVIENSFTTGTLAAVIANARTKGTSFSQVTGFDNTGKMLFEPNGQIGFLSIGNQELTQMTYNFTVTVTDAVGFVKSASVAVPPATLAQGNGVVPIGQILVANIPGNTAAVTLAAPSGSAATLKEASTANPWFIPDVKGNYTLTAGSTSISAHASGFQSASPTCGGCHTIDFVPDEIAANVAAKFKDWSNSAHGNHFFKFMHYDSSGKLVWNTDASGKSVSVPTANPTVSWKTPFAGDVNGPRPMTTFEFGMVGAEGTHYSASCVACHTTGYNALARNAGILDRMSVAPYSIPNLSNVFTSNLLTGATSQQVVKDGVVSTATYDQVTAAPVTGAWDAMPEAVKAFAGMQCESCHGPLNTHAAAATLPSGNMVKPVQEFSVAACAVCHDRPSNHDRVALWRQSRHANLEVAIGEAATHTSGNPDASCSRCHAAQGFVQYVKQLTGQLKDSSGKSIQPYWGPIGDPSLATFGTAGAPFLKNLGLTADKVQAITCAACHDAHTTGIRVEGETPMLPSGFKVSGAGTGAVCFVCHNSRNGVHNDAQNGVFFTSDLPGATQATSIGAPHEAAQGDVVAGANAFFVSGFKPSAHLAVKDSCVGCHMKTFPAGLTGTNTNHTWRIDSTSCGKCHGGATAPVDGEGLQAEFDAAVVSLVKAINSSATASVRNLYYKGSSRTVQIPADAVAEIVTGRSVGFKIHTATGMENPNASSGTVGDMPSAALGNFYTDSGATTKAFDLLKGVFAKANWNLTLVTADGSRSVHNPSFVFEVLSATQAAVQGSGAR